MAEKKAMQLNSGQKGIAAKEPQEVFCKALEERLPSPFQIHCTYAESSVPAWLTHSSGCCGEGGKRRLSAPAGDIGNACKEQKAPMFVRDHIFCPYK